MNNIDAAKILGLTGKITPEIIKKAYRSASSKYHPDRNPAGVEMMQAINEAYQILKDFDGDIDANNEDYGEELNKALNSLHGLSGITIEICGSWVWVTGDTKAHKEILKENSFKWSKPKTAWYFKPHSDKRRYRGTSSMEQIRENHGTKKYTVNQTLLAS